MIDSQTTLLMSETIFIASDIIIIKTHIYARNELRDISTYVNA